VSSGTRRVVLALYHHTVQPGEELDHRVPFSLCGADTYACGGPSSCKAAEDNLWPEPYDGVKVRPYVENYKDILESKIAERVRLHKMSLADGQAVFLGDWRTGYCQWVDPSPCALR
jgi:hypothetical protein